MQWRKQGDEQWQPTRLPLKSDGNKELVFIHLKHHNSFRCAKCKKSLSNTPYLWYRSVPRGVFSVFTEKRYCVKHTPISIEIDMQQELIPAQRIAVTDSNAASKDTSTEKPTTPEEPTGEAVVWSSQTRLWRKQGDEEWQSILIPLKGEENKELFFVPSRRQNKFKCATCGKSLSEMQYLFYRQVPKTIPYEQYCLEHSPIALETQEGPGLFQRIADLEQHITALEQRVVQLEATRPRDMITLDRFAAMHSVDMLDVTKAINMQVLRPDEITQKDGTTVLMLDSEGRRQFWEALHDAGTWTDCPICPHELY
jgi:DNA-directed RNA polymerase subunit RPC12/RpoP